MKILFVNDDGYDAIGIQSLYKAFSPYHDSYMCAPLSQKSAFSHAINCSDHLELKVLDGDVKGYALDSTPADCTRVSLNGLFDFPFDLILSGINYGVNAAQDIFYSGTVGAAREASFHGNLAIALSLNLESKAIIAESVVEEIFNYSAQMARRIVENLPEEIWQYKHSIININFPPVLKAKGIKLTTIGKHEYHTELCHSSIDDRDYVKIDTINKNMGSGIGTDIYHLAEEYIVVTALFQGVSLDQNLQSKLAFLEDLSTEI